MAWKLKRTTQCAKCPWRVDVDPNDIPNGYSADKHCALKSTIARPGDASDLAGGTMKVMACHETHDAHCVGWLMNQLGPGNNIGLRMRAMDCQNIGKIKLVGEQHERFEDTLPGQPGGAEVMGETATNAMSERMSPARTAQRYGHTRAFWTTLIAAGELPARDERMPGSKRPRYVIESDDVDLWKESRVVSPAMAARREPVRPKLARVFGVLAKRRAARRQAVVG